MLPLSWAEIAVLVFFEVIASVLIVFVHIQFPGIVGELVEGLARFAVPFFFTISGFYLMKKEMSPEELRKKLVTRIVRIGKITLVSFAIYFFLLGGQALIGGTFSEWISETFHWRTWVKLIVFNNPLLMVTNWFLVALLFSYLVIYLIPRPFLQSTKVVKIIACTLPVWVLIRLVMMATKAELWGWSLANPLFYRSWYASGLPFICFGVLLRQNEEKLKKISLKTINLGLIVSTVEMMMANYLFLKLFQDSIAYYIGSIFVVFFMMCLAAQYPTMLSKSRLVNAKGNWTMLLYIFHPAIIGIVQALVSATGLGKNTLILWIEPIFVLILSILLAILINFIIVRISAKEKHI